MKLFDYQRYIIQTETRPIQIANVQYWYHKLNWIVYTNRTRVLHLEYNTLFLIIIEMHSFVVWRTQRRHHKCDQIKTIAHIMGSKV